MLPISGASGRPSPTPADHWPERESQEGRGTPPVAPSGESPTPRPGPQSRWGPPDVPGDGIGSVPDGRQSPVVVRSSGVPSREKLPPRGSVQPDSRRGPGGVDEWWSRASLPRHRADNRHGSSGGPDEVGELRASPQGGAGARETGSTTERVPFQGNRWTGQTRRSAVRLPTARRAQPTEPVQPAPLWRIPPSGLTMVRRGSSPPSRSASMRFLGSVPW